MYVCSQIYSCQSRGVYWSMLEPPMNIKPIEEGTSRLTFGLRNNNNQYGSLWVGLQWDCTSALISDSFRESVVASIDNRPWKSTSYPASTTQPFPSLVCTRGPFLSGRTGKGPSSSSLSPSCETTKRKGRDLEALKQSERHGVTRDCAAFLSLPLPEGHVCDYYVNGAGPNG